VRWTKRPTTTRPSGAHRRGPSCRRRDRTSPIWGFIMSHDSWVAPDHDPQAMTLVQGELKRRLLELPEVAGVAMESDRINVYYYTRIRTFGRGRRLKEQFKQLYREVARQHPSFFPSCQGGQMAFGFSMLNPAEHQGGWF